MQQITVTEHEDGAPGIRERRKAAGLSQESLARAADCSTAMVKLLERGFTPTRSAVLPRIVRVLEEREAAGR
jgi:predicted transcriptional regulator